MLMQAWNARLFELTEPQRSHKSQKVFDVTIISVSGAGYSSFALMTAL